ncbi:Sel1 repeat-containing protein [Zymomonas mobilis]|uniref:tetratricopeptide repeat protein n=1 Tax=Zymomonas mobilis TaxID=542 RepID=UPI0011AC2C9B|nr:hypothetical protein [Zymomonas mobilis]TWD60236.1 Sel1 repeat-containing protein [Zymomonas mobilis]
MKIILWIVALSFLAVRPVLAGNDRTVRLLSDGYSIVEIQKNANAGDSQAQFSLGYAYAFGKNLPQDYEKAAFWYRKAAEQGFAPAPCQIAVAYVSGAGVSQNYKRAADQGYVAAIVWLQNAQN